MASLSAVCSHSGTNKTYPPSALTVVPTQPIRHLLSSGTNTNYLPSALTVAPTQPSTLFSNLASKASVCLLRTHLISTTQDQ
jgi:hypothetical protein